MKNIRKVQQTSSTPFIFDNKYQNKWKNETSPAKIKLDKG